MTDLVEYECKDCGLVFIDGEDNEGCPGCNSDNVESLGDWDEDEL